MIATLVGTVIEKLPNAAIIDTAGVGYRVELTAPHAAELVLDEPASIMTTMIVRDDSLILYGFATADEMELFRLLTSVPGVGPRIALRILSFFTPAKLAVVVERDDVRALAKVPGLPSKAAQMLTVSLKGKLAWLETIDTPPASSDSCSKDTTRTEVLSALVSLGWTNKAATEAINDVAKRSDTTRSSSGDLIRAALARLNRH